MTLAVWLLFVETRKIPIEFAPFLFHDHWLWKRQADHPITITKTNVSGLLYWMIPSLSTRPANIVCRICMQIYLVIRDFRPSLYFPYRLVSDLKHMPPYSTHESGVLALKSVHRSLQLWTCRWQNGLNKARAFLIVPHQEWGPGPSTWSKAQAKALPFCRKLSEYLSKKQLIMHCMQLLKYVGSCNVVRSVTVSLCPELFWANNVAQKQLRSWSCKQAFSIFLQISLICLSPLQKTASVIHLEYCASQAFFLRFCVLCKLFSI